MPAYAKGGFLKKATPNKPAVVKIAAIRKGRVNLQSIYAAAHRRLGVKSIGRIRGARKSILLILLMILLLAIAGVVIAQDQEKRKPDGSKTDQNDTGMDDLRKLFYFGMSEQQLIQMLTKDAELVGIGTSDQLESIGISFFGTRMNTDYQDIKSYKKPNICENL
jgi:hypothetical protein